MPRPNSKANTRNRGRGGAELRIACRRRAERFVSSNTPPTAGAPERRSQLEEPAQAQCEVERTSRECLPRSCHNDVHPASSPSPPSVPITNGWIQIRQMRRNATTMVATFALFFHSGSVVIKAGQGPISMVPMRCAGSRTLLSAVLRREVFSAPATPSTPCSPPAHIGQTP